MSIDKKDQGACNRKKSPFMENLTMNKNSVTKSTNLVDAGFFKKLNSTEMRIFAMAVAKINPLRDQNQDKGFHFSVKEYLEKNTGVTDSNSNVYSNIKIAIENLLTTVVPVIPRKGFTGTKVQILSEMSYFDGEGRFYIEFHEKIMPYLTEIHEKYTSYLLTAFGSLKSEHSLKLFEIFKRWEYQKECEFTLEELKYFLGVSDNYERWDNFKSWVLDQSLKEINEKTDLNVTFSTVKTGRKITGVKFVILGNTQEIEVKRPKFPHKNRYGNFVKFNGKNPTSSSVEYANYAKDCLKILEEFYQDKALSDVDLKDLRHYYNFLSVSGSHKSKLGNKSDFLTQIKNRGYTLVEGDLKKISEKSAASEDKFAISPRPSDSDIENLNKWAMHTALTLEHRHQERRDLTLDDFRLMLECYELTRDLAGISRTKAIIEVLEKEKDR